MAEMQLRAKLTCGTIAKTQVWLPSAQKTNTQETSFEWKGIGALFKSLATWEEGRLLSKCQLQGFCLAKRFYSSLFNQLRECSDLSYSLIASRLMMPAIDLSWCSEVL